MASPRASIRSLHQLLQLLNRTVKRYNFPTWPRPGPPSGPPPAPPAPKQENKEVKFSYITVYLKGLGHAIPPAPPAPDQDNKKVKFYYVTVYLKGLGHAMLGLHQHLQLLKRTIKRYNFPTLN
jgi:hypothetical protein